jgi:hypothetical protein
MALAGEIAGTVTALLCWFLTFIWGEKTVPDRFTADLFPRRKELAKFQNADWN